MGSHQRFQRFTVRRQNNHRIGGQPGHYDFPSQLPIRHATAPPIRLLFCYRKAASLRLPSYLHARRSRNFRSAVLAIRRALEAAGVEFIDGNGGGPGVRLREGSHPVSQRADRLIG
jgi:hypothetical protein